MKKVLAVLMTLVLAVTLCVPSFAADPTESGVLDQIIATVGPVIEQIIGSITGGGTPTLPDVSAPSSDELMDMLKDMLQDTTLDATTAEAVVSVMLNAGASKADVEAVIQQLEADGTLNAESVAALRAALEAAEEPTTEAPIVSDEQAQEIATQVISALQGLGISADQMRDVAQELYDRGILPHNVYELVIAQINASEETTAAENDEGGIGGLLGGVGDFFGGIFDTIGGMLGFGGGEEGGSGEGGDVDEEDNIYGGGPPNGDTVVFAVVGVAAAAGAALLLTRKKKSDK